MRSQFYTFRVKYLQTSIINGITHVVTFRQRRRVKSIIVWSIGNYKVPQICLLQPVDSSPSRVKNDGTSWTSRNEHVPPVSVAANAFRVRICISDQIRHTKISVCSRFFFLFFFYTYRNNDAIISFAIEWGAWIFVIDRTVTDNRASFAFTTT